MSLIRADIPTIVIGMKDIGFANAGINQYNTYKIIKIADPFESYNPLDPVNAITGFEKDAAYFFFSKETIDLTGIADNAVPVNLDTTSGNNVFANMAFAGVAKTTASFATVGFNTSNLLWIYKVSDPYESYNPNDPYNPIDGFEINECYYGYALADMDLNAYLIPPIVIKDDVEKATDTYKYWGTEATTDKDFYNVPVRFFADEASLPTTGIENIVYVAKAESTSWYWDGAVYQPIGGGGTSYTDEQAQDAVGTILSSEFTYSDATPQISINQIAYSKITGTPSIPTQYTDALAKAANPQSKSITIESCTSTENIGFFYTDIAITVTALADVIKGTSPSVTWQINHATARNSGSPNLLLSASRTTTSVTGATTTTFNDATIPAGSWIWFTSSAQSGTVTELSITLKYTID